MTPSRDDAVTVRYRTKSRQLSRAVQRLSKTLQSQVIHQDISDPQTGATDILIIAGETDLAALKDDSEVDTPSSIIAEGFRITKVQFRETTVCTVLAEDETGAMYGLSDIGEQIAMGKTVADLDETESNPDVPFRAIKFNLPWSPYREGPQNDLHLDTCLDLGFWEDFLDMMAKNRFNALSLWNLHPFSYMIQTEQFPEATSVPEDKLDQWMEFWHSLFTMAADRGIDTYIVNWNAIVSPEFAAAHEGADNYRELVDEYTRDCVTQVIDEYDNLTGLGVSLTNEHLSETGVCEWFRELSPKERQDWFDSTILSGIGEASRSVKLLNRSVRTDSIDEMRRVINSAANNPNVSDIVVPTKFNWSHGHSSTDLELTHDYEDGTVDNSLWSPEPEDYDIAWTVRNEDFFVLRWGDHEFIREHVEENFKQHDYVSGYFIGSEGFIPAKDISHDHHRHQTWQYIFEKQWLFYFLWGRLLYDTDLPTHRIEAAFERRYGSDVSSELLEAYTKTSKMPIELASFHASTWDYALYSEGFLAIQDQLGLDDEVSPFISVNELIYHRTLDPEYVSIVDYVDNATEGRTDEITPLELADRVEQRGRRTIEISKQLQNKIDIDRGQLECEIQDLLAWGYLSLYFANKLRGGVALATFRETGNAEEKDRAVSLLRTAAKNWDSVIDVTQDHYRPHPYAGDWEADLRETLGDEFSYPEDYFPDAEFSWAKFRDQVERDIEIAQQASVGDSFKSQIEYDIS